MSPSKRVLAVALLVASQGCYIDFKRPGGPKLVADPLPRRADHQAGDRRLGDGFGRKIVEGKRPPVWLLAGDGTSCSVTEKKYNSTIPGSPVWCAWLGTSR